MGKAEQLLVDQAYETIRKDIFDGVYQPGEKLRTREISERLGMSRTPVVSAVNRLVAQGIATDIPHRGVVVSQMTPSHIRDFLDMRRMMESFVVHDAIKNVGFFPETMREMERLAGELIATPDTEYNQISTLERQFHINFIKLGNNAQLSRLYESNWGIGFAVYTFVSAKVPVQQYRESCEEHFRFLEYLKRGDEAALQDALNQHMKTVYSTIKWLEKSEKSI